MKVYEKPQIIIERFELSQNVADCTWNMNQQENTSCYGDGADKGYDDKLFSAGNTVCDIGTDVLEDYCYTASQSGNNIFMS